MGKTSTKIQPVPNADLESFLGAQRYLNLFERLSMLIGGEATTAEVGTRACELIAELLDVAACSISVLCDDGDFLHLLAATHIPREEWSKIKQPARDGIYGPIVARRESLLIRDRKDFEKHFQRPSDSRYESASCVIVPLTIQDRVVGTISVAHPLSRRWFELRDLTLLESAARLVGSALHSSDRFHEAIELQKRLTDLFNSLHVGIIAVDAEDRITQSNHRARVLFNFTAGCRPRLEDALKGTVYNVCCRLIRKVQEEGGKAEDELEIKVGEEKRMLKIRVMPSIDELIGERLIVIDEVGQEEEIKRLRESESAKHSFLSIISHELRTPLTVIKTALPMLAPKETPTPPAVLAQVHKLLANNTHRLIEVVNSIIYVTELEAGTLELSQRPTDLHRLLTDTLERYAAGAEQRRLRLVTRFEAPSGEIVADAQRLGTIFSEMINNALKFSAAGNDVIVETSIREPWFEIRVTNTGATIDTCMRKNIFRKFYQGNQTMTRTVGGCGLGLFLVSNIVRMHGGTVELLESKGNETTFQIRLPLTVPAAKNGASAH